MEFRTIEPDEFDAFLTTVANAFAEPSLDDFEVLRDRKRLETDRLWAAIDDGRIVGGLGAYSWPTTVPGGGSLATACLTAVGVLPTHRRRGILAALMGRVLAQSAERGEPLSILFASEAAIYGRFGFGRATVGLELDVHVDRTPFVEGAPSGGRTRLLAREDALGPMKGVYDVAAARRPGMIPLDERDFDWLFTESGKREEKPFYAVHEDDEGSPDAYVVYRAKHEWPDGLPHVEVTARQLVASTPLGAAAIWRFLFDIDLVHRVKTDDRPIDEPLQWLLREPRAMRAKLFDGLYARPVDVPSALAGRGYAAEGRLVLEVVDRFVPANDGTYELTVRDGRALCVRTADEPDLACGVDAVGAVFLGGATWRELSRAGRVQERHPAALAAADAMFSCDPPPWAPFMF